jgi:hypothetical protein
MWTRSAAIPPPAASDGQGAERAQLDARIRRAFDDPMQPPMTVRYALAVASALLATMLIVMPAGAGLWPVRPTSPEQCDAVAEKEWAICRQLPTKDARERCWKGVENEYADCLKRVKPVPCPR